MFERYTCWNAVEAKKILRPLALEGNEAVFRATHSPISGLIVTGTEAHDVTAATEKGLLAALSSTTRRHAMCVVEGEAGSGKSHLIRWLKVNWPSGIDLPILIERADGTLDGTLRQLNEKLARETGTNLDAIVPRHKLTEQGQRVSLLLQLGNLCRSGTLSEPLGDEDWCEKHGVSDMLQSEAVRTSWKAPQRVLDVLTKGADRDSKVANFTPRDMLELSQPLAGLRGRNVGPGAIRLAQKLRQETQAVDSALASCRPGFDEPDISSFAPYTTSLLAALNSRLSLAIQSAMGINGAALQKMFRDLRRILLKKGRRLVLLLEDLTGAQGVDQELLYVLQERSTTQQQFCDIVSVVGLTPAYFRQYIEPQANVVQRVTHHVRFGQLKGSFQAVSALENPSEQVEFAARYLRAVRAGMEEINQAARDNNDVINRCEKCLHRNECHATFGHVGAVGLYPLTQKAIERMFLSLRDPKGTMFLQTPRSIIQAVLAPSLNAESAIRAGTFPVPTVETEWHPESKREVYGLAHELIQKEPEEVRDRLRITVAWWGDGGFPVSGEAQGEWAGVPDRVFAAWGLSPPAKPTPVIQPKNGTKTGSLPTPPPKPNGGKPIRSTRERQPQHKTIIDEQLERLRSWSRTKLIEDDGFWRNRAEAFIKKINWKDEDIPHWYVREALGEVRLEGSGRTDQRNVVIPCTEWVVRGLEWSARLETGKVSPEAHEFAMQSIAVFVQNLRRVIHSWINSRVPEVKPGKPWSFDITVVQVLLTRAWLRGETRPGAPLVEQWKVILSDDSSDGVVERTGVPSWNNYVNQFMADFALHKRLRNLAECGEGVANVAFAAPAICTLAEEGRFASFPDNPPEQPVKTKWLSALAESAMKANRALTDFPAKEVNRLRESVRRINDIVGVSGFVVYLARVAIAFDKVRHDLPSLSASELSAWFKQYDSKKTLVSTGIGTECERLNSFLVANSLETLPDDVSVSVLLDHAIQAPIDLLEKMDVLLKETSALVNTFVNYLEEHEPSISKIQDATTVVDFGQQIVKSAAKLREIVQGTVPVEEALS